MSNRGLEIKKPLLANEQPLEDQQSSSVVNSVIELQKSYADLRRKERKFLDIPHTETDIQKNLKQPEEEKQQPEAALFGSIVPYSDEDEYVEPTKKKELEIPKSNSTLTIIMAVIDGIGGLGFLTYCGFLQTYLSTFYLIMMILTFNFMIQKSVRGIGMFKDSTLTSKVLIPMDFFVRKQNKKSFDSFDQQEDQENPQQSHISQNKYQSRYWIVFRDLQIYFWIIILIVSMLSLINKIVFYVILNTSPQSIQNLMSYSNFQGLEIYFSLDSSDSSLSFSTIEYLKTFAPNSFILLWSIIAVILTRVEEQVGLETQNFEINAKAFKFYLAIVWLLLLALIFTASSIQGIVFLIFQLAITLKIFIKEKSPNTFEFLVVKILKFYIFLMIIVFFAFGTQSGIEYQQDIRYLGSFIGLDLFSEIHQEDWKSLVFVISSLILSIILCLLSNQMEIEQRRVNLHPTILKCVDHYELFSRRQGNNVTYQELKKHKSGSIHSVAQSEQMMNEEIIQPPQSSVSEPVVKYQSLLQSQKSSAQQYSEKINSYITEIADKIRLTLDNPLVTLRILQITTIIVILLQKTYFSLVLCIWVFGSGITLSMKFNYITTNMFAIPPLFFGILAQLWAIIPFVGIKGNEFTICVVGEKQDIEIQKCQKYGLYKDDYSYINVIMMDVSLCACLLLQRQIHQFQEAQLNQKKIKSQGLHFMTKKKEKKLEDVSYGTILTALIFKISYFISLFILFWAGFHKVNILQFILILFLLIFLVNDSQMSIYKYKKPSKQLNQPPEVKTVLVPFTFKYWWILVVYTEFLIIVRYIYIFFFSDNDYSTSYYLNVIGINGDKYYEVIFWVLFYFVALQYDSYRSEVYIKYSNVQNFHMPKRLTECIMQKGFMKKLLPTYRKNEGILQLLYLKFIIWVSFFVNLMILIFTNYNYINSFLLFVAGLIFCYFVGSLIEGVNYKRMKILQYFYLNVLVLAFVIRYALQFACIDGPFDFIGQIKQILKNQFQVIGLYSYNIEHPSLRLEYFPDILTIFLGALSLNTFEIFSMSQMQMNINRVKQTMRSMSGVSGREASSRRGSNNSQLSGDEQSLDLGERNTHNNLLQEKLKNDTNQLAQLMEISILDEWGFLKTPILLFANINTDIITIYVVVTAVFVTKSVALWLIMLFYLRFYLIVHNRILTLLQKNGILRNLNTKVENLKEKYLHLEVKARKSLRLTDQQDMQKLVREIKLTRLTTRIQVKKEVGRQSFYFTSFCAFLTYMSLSLTANIGEAGNQWWKYLNYSFFVFGTYATQEQIEGRDIECFCSPCTATQRQLFSFSNSNYIESNILDKIWFFLLLILVNVIDTMSTQVLMEDLDNENTKFKNEYDINQSYDPKLLKIESAPVISQKKQVEESGKQNKKDQQKGLNPIKEEEEEEKEAKSRISIQIDQIQPVIKKKSYLGWDFQHESTFTNNKTQTPNQQFTQSAPQKETIVEEEDIEITFQAQKYALLIQFYKNKDILLGITFYQAFFKILQRFFILIFLLNTLLANNVFSFYYLGVATYLFLQKPNVIQMRFLNTCSIFAIAAQYILLLLNLEQPFNLPTVDDNNKVVQFSVIKFIGLNDQDWLTFFGFDNTFDLPQSCAQADTFKLYQNCQGNNHLYWVFILNTLVLSLIYSYFLILELLTNHILKKTMKMERGMTETEQVIITQLKADSKVKITIDYSSWKDQFYTFKNALFNTIVRSGHLITIALILILTQTNRVIFNQIELVLALVFLFCIKLFFNSPNTEDLHSSTIKYFRILFYIPVLTIFSFTALKLPTIMNWCYRLDSITITASSYDYFVCSQIFGINITGMAFVMFFIAIFFDLVNSNQHSQNLKEHINTTLLQARMISRCLAYDLNQGKYREILYEQYQRNIFKQIQIQIMEKLKIWHRRMKDPQATIKEDEKEESQAQSEFNEQKEEELTLIKPPEDDSFIPDEQVEATTMQKYLINTIVCLQKNNNQFKFMGVSNLMDYILESNRVLDRHVYVSVEEYIREDFVKFRTELDLIDTFYASLFREIAIQQEIDFELIDKVVKESIPDQKLNLENEEFLKQSLIQDNLQGNQELIQDQQEQVPKFKDYKLKKELEFVHIQDEKITFYNTKYCAKHQDFIQYTSCKNTFLNQVGLIRVLLKELGKYLISNFSVLCYIAFLLYFCKNSGMSGGVLPAILFLWILIEEGQAPRVFWMLAFSYIALILILIFALTQEGLFVKDKIQEQIDKVHKSPKWYPIYDVQGGGMEFETILIWMIIIQLILQKKWGVLNTTIMQIENIFKGYIRMKINNFRLEVIQEIKKEEPLVKNIVQQDGVQRTASDIRGQDRQIKRSQTQAGYNIQTMIKKISRSFADRSEFEALDDQIVEINLKEKLQIAKQKQKIGKNNFEKRILNQTDLLNTNDNFSFFERTFANKFAKPGRDLYPLIAGVQIIIFFYILFFFTIMISDDGRNSLNSIITYNQIPGGMVIALLCHMTIMVIERYITLRTTFLYEENHKKDDLKQQEQKQLKEPERKSQTKADEEYYKDWDQASALTLTKELQNNIPQQQIEDKDIQQKYRIQFLLKYILLIIQLIVVYWFIFYYLGKPFKQQLTGQNYDSLQNQTQTSKDFQSSSSITIFFLIYSAYFYLSCLQLRYGYRQLKMRNTFLQYDSQPAYIYGKGFYAVPFLFELKVLMDWTFLQTSLDVFQWFKLEDIHGLIYFAKISAQGYQGRAVGQRVPPIQKLGLGCTLVTFILICIFGPLILFSTLNPSSESNLINGGQFTINLVNTVSGLNVPLYESNQLNGLNITLTNKEQIESATNTSQLQNPIFLTANQNGAVQEFQLLPFSNQDWSISQPLFKLLTQQLNQQIQTNQSTFLLNITYILSREKATSVSNKNTFSYPGNELIMTSFNQTDIYLSVDDLIVIYDNMINCSQNPLILDDFYIQTLQIKTQDGTTFKPRPVVGGINSVQNVTMVLKCGQNDTLATTTQSWWEFTYNGTSKSINYKGQQGLLFFVASDNYSSLTSGFSIITIYTTVILVIGAFIRSLFSGQVFLIEFNDMLKPDDLLMICEAISIARSQKDFIKENMLYFELIDILRSPEIVKIMTGSWSETFKKKYIKEKNDEKNKKLKQD